MNLGITVEQVVEAKFGSYLNTLSKEEREKKLKEYSEAAGDSIRGAIKEAETMVDSVQTTITTITSSVPTTIAQIASLAALIDPTAKATQLISIKEAIGNAKDQINRANAQLSSISTLLSQLSLNLPIVNTLTGGLASVTALLNTIPV